MRLEGKRNPSLTAFTETPRLFKSLLAKPEEEWLNEQKDKLLVRAETILEKHGITYNIRDAAPHIPEELLSDVDEYRSTPVVALQTGTGEIIVSLEDFIDEDSNTGQFCKRGIEVVQWVPSDAFANAWESAGHLYRIDLYGVLDRLLSPVIPSQITHFGSLLSGIEAILDEKSNIHHPHTA